ncbi:ribonuclease E/G [Pararhizobium mangrovi]|uniref:Ribonuclease E n=1 Tax=Pararhizobium mangrovi TaxID=2590452 RepID=A0A506UA20_9HYPH|nr:ribonuclease E/G [Pararhizobium mangrovi]TPW31233.1 Rne/Rng family ribonuclease [Pararhizobium mangrovi]
MAEKMLIDASHEEETRVVVVRGNRIEEFDFESQHKKQLRGNIYLAKVTRVEPSLQAAFVEYGGNRHGFLAFSEIHPDYYQIPLADRQALLQAEAEAEREQAESENGERDSEEAETKKARSSSSKSKPRRSRSRKKTADAEAETADDGNAGTDAETPAEDVASQEPSTASDEAAPNGDEAVAAHDVAGADDETPAEVENHVDEPSPDEDKSGPDEMLAAVETDSVSEEIESEDDDRSSRRGRRNGRSSARRNDDHNGEDETNGDGTKVESVGAEDALEELPERSQRAKPRKQYRIQEVIKRRQILLVQVVKEERGNKGAALTTYLSLAGRYSVLMPNTARGGGISRKITNVTDRKRLREIAHELDVPQGMGVILRTAGANRTKAEIKRDFEYLMRLWENVRNRTLTSKAPTLVYEEGSLIKRSIRDLYNKDINEIVVSGDEGYREAKAFMRMLMPSHAKVVQPYRDIHPIYARSGIEGQLDRMLQPQVTLKSGGYVIINQTEALVAIDVNSGRSTKEHSIEETAYQTNLEAAEEIARQLRLRDLAGLIVIDFIDMEEKKNNRTVEKKMKDCLKNDRARIQVGRISHFGLLEMSRQRIRASVLESTTQVCEVCNGTGHVRSKSSVALYCIRGIEDYLLKNTTHDITVRALPETALYLLNQKRETIVEFERRFGLSIAIEADENVTTQHFEIDRGEPVPEPVRIENLAIEIEEAAEAEAEADEAAIDEIEETPDTANGEDGSKRKRRRRRRGGRGSDDHNDASETAEASGEDGGEAEAHDGEDDDDDAQRQRKRRRRGKRGGRRKRASDQESGASDESSSDDHEADEGSTPDAEQPVASEPEAGANSPADDDQNAAAAQTPEEPGEKKKPRRSRRRRKDDAESETPPVEADAVEPAVSAPEANVAEETPTPGPIVATDANDEPADGDASPVEENATEAARQQTTDEPFGSEPVVTSSEAETDTKAEKPKRKRMGWWQRRGFL